MDNTMSTGKLFKNYTGKFCSVFNRILSEYGSIRCKKNPVFTVVLCSDSPCKHWARIEIRANDGVLWFGKRIAFGTHYCGINCSIISKKFDTLHNAVIESSCIYLKDVFIFIFKRPTLFDHKCITNHNYLLLQFQKCFEADYSCKLKFKKVSIWD